MYQQRWGGQVTEEAEEAGGEEEEEEAKRLKAEEIAAKRVPAGGRGAFLEPFSRGHWTCTASQLYSVCLQGMPRVWDALRKFCG